MIKQAKIVQQINFSQGVKGQRVEMGFKKGFKMR